MNKDENGREIVLEVISGSHLYGTADKNSDMDIRRVVIPMPHELLGMHRFETQVFDKDQDIVTHSLSKFVRLLLNGNFNTHEWLCGQDKDYNHVSEIGKELIKNRHKFQSMKIVKSIRGYIQSQIKLSFSIGGGDKRKALIKEHGYNTKAAYHALRLCWVAIIFMDTWMIVPQVKDISLLMDIKYGKVNADKALKIIQEVDESLSDAIEKNYGMVPEKPDTKFAEEFVYNAHLHTILMAKKL